MPEPKIDGLTLIFEDASLIILDKPAGVVVNRSATHTGVTVQDFIEANFKLVDDLEEAPIELSATATQDEQEPSYPDEFLFRSGIVHRIDKDTSGILVAAKTKSAFRNLQMQFKGREVHKDYAAFVIGAGLAPKFEVDAPIDRNPKSRLTMAITPQGKPAKTTFELLEEFEVSGSKYSYVKAVPLTGRTHQIRVHLAALNHPVVGDQIYCSRAQLDSNKDAFTRMMLHALSIEFTHPLSQAQVSFRAELPEDFLKYL